MNEVRTEEMDFGKTEIPTLFRKIFIPTLLGMIAGVSLTIADGIFVGRGVGSDALAAINIVAPLFMLVTGLALMAGIGCSIAVSLNMAKGKFRIANLHMNQSVMAFTLLIILLAAAIAVATGPISSVLGATDRLAPLATNYLYYIAYGFPCLLLMNMGMFVIRLDGNPQYAMLCSVIPAAINMLLDYLFIFPFGMGIEGAAIATTLGFVSGGIMVMTYLVRRGKKLKIQLRLPNLSYLKCGIRNIGWHIRLGSSALFGELAVAVMMFAGNYVFVRMLGEDGVAAFSVACYCYPLVFMVSNAIGQSAQPIISYNYGQQNNVRLRQAVKITFLTASATGMLITALMVILGHEIISLFLLPDSTAYRIAVEGMPLFALGFLLFLLNIAAVSYYQSTERTLIATSISTLRGVVFPVITFTILPYLFGVAGIWLSVACADGMALALLSIIYIRQRSA